MMWLTMRKFLQYTLSLVALAVTLGMDYEVIPVVWRGPIVLVIIVSALAGERHFRRCGGLRKLMGR